MRLTPEFVSKAPSHSNASKERESDSRGSQIPVIENLASHQGSYDTLNLTDNSLTTSGNIPSSTRLSAIHAANNQITSIAPSLPPNIPNIVTLVLTNNAIASLAALVPLESLIHLKHSSLRGNPVTQHEHYREFTVWKVAKGGSRTLDFERIKDATREAAIEKFTDPSTSQPNASAVRLSTSTTTVVPGATAIQAKSAVGKGGKGRSMTPEEKKRVVEASTRAKTADEVRRLERMSAEGLIPDGEAVTDGADE